MATFENKGILTYKDKNGDIHQMYPTTRRECLLNMEEIDTHLVDCNNPHGVTAAQSGSVPITRIVNGHELSKDIELTPGDLGIVLDTDLTLEGGYAEAKSVGDSINSLSNNFFTELSGVSSVANNALAIGMGKAAMSTATVTLEVGAWSEKMQTVELLSVTDNNTLIVGSHPDNNNDYSAMGVYCASQRAGEITFSCLETPSMKLLVNVIILD